MSSVTQNRGQQLLVFTLTPMNDCLKTSTLYVTLFINEVRNITNNRLKILEKLYRNLQIK